VVDTPGTRPKTVHVYDLVADGTKGANGRVFFDATPDFADGIRCDTEGNARCSFVRGTEQDGAVFVASSQSVYEVWVYVETRGAIGGDINQAGNLPIPSRA
jgi:sugar lactone lactonase YvrE